MSRREFRAALDDPRPLAAYWMVAIATTALAITGQLASWCLATWVLLIGLAALLRSRPRAFQTSGLLLNSSLAATVALCATLWFRGALALVVLAHFVTLAQALQFLDARPRRSEFLLVALALFQMILASNLTDSVLFPPLLMLFVPATVWTLLVHTLRTEALEAGTPGAASRVLTPSLLHVTLLATGMSLLLALVLFLVLPRLRSGSMMKTPLGSNLAAAGFSDRVQLGDLGRIRQDPTVVLRVETIRGASPPIREAYWRGLAFDRFDGRSWSVTPPGRERLPGVSHHGIRLPGNGSDAELVQRIVREPVASGVLFGAGRPVEVRGDIGAVARDADGGLYAGSTVYARIRYTIETRTTRRDEAGLKNDPALPPQDDGQRFLALPPLSPAVRDLALGITEGARDDAERARQIEEYLLRTGRYTDTPPATEPGASHSPVEVFLFQELAGHCEYFATAFVVLARAVGIPARLVNGFAGGRENVIGGFVELARSDAHAWAEVHYARSGWVRYDPTPPDLRLRAASGTSVGAHVLALASALEHWWFQHVVEFDRSDQADALRDAWLAWRAWRTTDEQAPPRDADAEPGFVTRLRELATGREAGGLVTVLALVLAYRTLRRRRRNRAGPLPDSYRRALRLLSRHGLVRQPQATAREFARVVDGAVPARAATAFRSITENYLALRFGDLATPPAAAELHELRDALRRERRGRPGGGDARCDPAG